MSEGVQESLCSIFNPFECEFSTSYESALQDGIAALQAQLVDDDKVYIHDFFKCHKNEPLLAVRGMPRSSTSAVICGRPRPLVQRDQTDGKIAGGESYVGTWKQFDEAHLFALGLGRFLQRGGENGMW